LTEPVALADGGSAEHYAKFLYALVEEIDRAVLKFKGCIEKTKENS